MLKKYVAVALAVAVVFGSAGLPAAKSSGGSAVIEASAEDVLTYGDYEYTLLEDGTAEIVEYRGSDTDVTIPGEIGVVKVTSIGKEAFYCNDNVVSVTLPDSVTNLGYHAFYWCSQLEKVTLPNNITSIAVGVFGNCVKLVSINIPNSLTSIGEGAFAGCGFESITIPNSVTSIEGNTFAGCELKSISIPDSVKSIGEGAFFSCKNLKSITIPDSVTSIGSTAFCDSGLTSITLPNSITTLENGVLADCINLTSITIPDSVTSIDTGAISGCTSLTSITLPDSITSIGTFAFSQCTSLKSINIPDSVRGFEYATFRGCSSLTSINLPEDFQGIGESAFENCSSLTSITIPKRATVDLLAFSGCTNLKKAVILGNDTDSYYTSLSSSGLGFEYGTEDTENAKKIDGFTIYCYKNSKAQQYAIDNGFDYVLLDEDEPVSLTDAATGVKVEAEAGVVPGDAKLIVEPITSGEGYDKAAKALGEVKAFRLFEIHLEDAQGKEIQPDGKVTVSIPVPEEFGEDLAVYRINDDGTATKMEGSAKDGVFTYLSDSFSHYALTEAKQAESENVGGDGSSTENTDNTDNAETTPGTTDGQGDTAANPKTGAAATGAGVMLAAAIAVAAKKRNK